MKYSYNTNWMGPVSMEWYRSRGLTTTVREVLEHDSKFTDLKKGDVFEREDITEQWAGGRIDIYGGRGYPDEIGLPIMHGADYGNFSKWLEDIKSAKKLNLDQLVAMYEVENPKIRWAREHFGVQE